MRVRLGGVRGSSPRSGPGFMRFGGATSCVFVEEGGTRMVLDAGTGLRTLLPELIHAGADNPVVMLFTHYHLDHLVGLPAFSPLYDPDWHVAFAAPVREGVTVEMAINRLVVPPFWPAVFRARQRFGILPESADGMPCQFGPLRVRWCALHHRNGCHAYRIDSNESGASMALVTDLDWAASSQKEREAVLRLCGTPRPVDLLVMEGHGESSRFEGWGHSVWRETVTVAKTIGVRLLVITHHAPSDDDQTLLDREAAVQGEMAHACLGYEDMSIVWEAGAPRVMARPLP